MAATTATLVCTRPDTRSVGPVSLVSTLTPPQTFARADSTGVFVGVSDFTHDRQLTVPYAADDAVDLAHRFVINQRTSLVPPHRAVLLLSGRPQKEQSRRRLDELREAGATILMRATSDDIFNQVREQAARAGKNGLFVLSLASHGFVQNGDAYVLGSASVFRSPETSLRLAKLFDLAGQAGRSLIFVDACRERVMQDSRSLGPEPDSAAPVITKMRRVHGQVIFYAAAAGQYAYDDHEHQNGVFTKTVLDGLDCKASAPDRTVIAETLQTYVEREVRRWILEKQHRVVNPATQVSMEGSSGNMPLSECWRRPGPKIRVEIDGSTITTYASDTTPLWSEDFGEPVVHAEAADLDADARYEVIVGLRGRILALDRDKHLLWSKAGDGMSLRTFATGDLYEKHTHQVVAVWSDGQTSQLRIIESDGQDGKHRYEHAGILQRVAIGRPTRMFSPKITVTDGKALYLLHARTLRRLWRTPLASTSAVVALRILDVDQNNREDIAVQRKNDSEWFTFDGKRLRR